MRRIAIDMRTAALLALCIPFVGCATIMGPSAETIVFESDPEGQTVIVDGKSYTMPCLGTDKDHTAKFPNGQEMKIARSFQGWFLGNILLGGLIGMAIDTVTGGIMLPHRRTRGRRLGAHLTT